MAIILDIILIIAAIVAIISFFTPKEKEPEHQSNDIGLYEVELELDGRKETVQTEVELLREYDDGEIHVRHGKVFTVFDNIEIGLKVDSLLKSDHTLINKKDVKWIVK